MKEKNIREIAKRMGLITVEDMCQYTIAQLVVKIANKVNELVGEVWRFETDVQEILKTQNENIQYLLGEGLHLEVENIFDGWVQDGTFDTLINQSALKKVNDRIDETNAQLSEKANQFDLDLMKIYSQYTDSNILMLQSLPKDNYIESTTTISEDKKHIAFTSMIKFNNAIYLIYRKGETHVSFDGALYMKKSTDGGNEWSEEIKVVEINGYDCRDPFFIEFNGKVVLKFVKRQDGDVRKTCIMYSSDMMSWSSPHELPNPIGTSNASRGNMCIKDGELYTINYDMWGGTFLLKTSDLIKWTVINPLILPNTNEASIEYRWNKFYALFRRTELDREPLILGMSDDGVSWEFIDMPFRGHCPTIKTVQLNPSGTFMAVTYREVSRLDTSMHRSKFCLTFIDEKGNILINPIEVHAQRQFDIGYGDVISADDHLYISYYNGVNSTKKVFFDKYNKFKIYEKILNIKDDVPNYMPYTNRNGERSYKRINNFYCGEIQVTGDGTQRKTFRVDLTPYNFTSGAIEVVSAVVTNDVFQVRLNGVTTSYIEFTLVCDNPTFTTQQLVKYMFLHRT